MKSTPQSLRRTIPTGYLNEYQHPTPEHLEDVTFPVGTIVVTPAAMEALEFEGAGKFLTFLLRHAAGFKAGRRKQSERHVSSGIRFDLMSGESLMVLLEAEEQITTVMLLTEGLK